MRNKLLFSSADHSGGELSAGDTQPMQTPRFDKIGNFLIEEKIGEGGMGIVYRAHDPTLQRTVAIKKVHPRLKDHQDIRDKFLAEARAIAAVNHPNIGQIHAIHGEEDLPYFVMEFLEGPSYEQIQARDGKLDTLEILKVALSATSALQEARQKGIIHRDVKPSNLLLDSHGVIKLVDFGLAGSIEESNENDAEVAGTPQYCSPEQVQGFQMDERSDIYSLGATLYHLLTGRPPFERETRMELLIAHVNAGIAAPSTLMTQVDPELEHLILRMLMKLPEDRPQNYKELNRELQALDRRLNPDRQRITKTSILSTVVTSMFLVTISVALFAPDSFDRVLGRNPETEMVNESLSSWLKTNDQKDQLVFDFSQGSAQLSRFFQNQELESSPGGRKIISPVIKDGQLRWANDPRPISFPYMQELDLWHIKGLRVLGRPDLELRVAEDPDNPGSRWRIGLSVGLARPPQIEILKDGTPIQVEIESHKVTAPVREGVDLELILEKLPLQEINRVQYRLIVQPLGTQDPPSLATIFSIPAGSIPSGAPQLRCEGDITGWNTKINFMKLSGKLDRDRILRDGSSRSSP